MIQLNYAVSPEDDAVLASIIQQYELRSKDLMKPGQSMYSPIASLLLRNKNATEENLDWPTMMAVLIVNDVPTAAQTFDIAFNAAHNMIAGFKNMYNQMGISVKLSLLLYQLEVMRQQCYACAEIVKKWRAEPGMVPWVRAVYTMPIIGTVYLAKLSALHYQRFMRLGDMATILMNRPTDDKQHAAFNKQFEDTVRDHDQKIITMISELRQISAANANNVLEIPASSHKYSLM
jgi:hypothetical protein